MSPVLPKVDCSRGAPMGRRDLIPAERRVFVYRFYLRRLHWVDGDYDEGGAYWGNVRDGMNVYWAECPWHADPEQHARLFVRASTRRQAKQRVRETFPLAVFYR